MKIHAVVPVKRLSESKRRLSSVLSPQERVSFTLEMLRDVLDGLTACTGVSQITVLCQDQELREFLHPYNVEFRVDSRSGLNHCLLAYERSLSDEPSPSLLYVMSDLPLLEALDLLPILNDSNVIRQLTIAPSRDGGTNVLLKQADSMVPPLYGRSSSEKHAQSARSHNIPVKFITNPNLQLDIDTAADLAKLIQLHQPSHARDLLLRGVEDRLLPYVSRQSIR